jgi:hypothetical protein
MPVLALSSTSRDAYVGAPWLLSVMVLDADGDLIGVTPTVAITLPDGTAGTPPTLGSLTEGVYRGEYLLTVPGRHLATVTAAGYGNAVFALWAAGPTATVDLPTADDLDAYLTAGSGAHDWSDDDLSGALAAEQDAQRRMCKIGPVYTADLREALLRRAQRNLALRSNALAMFRGDAESGDPQAFLPGTDPEVRRLERPYRKLPLG